MDFSKFATMGAAELEELRKPLVYIPNTKLHQPCVPIPDQLFGSDILADQICCQYATMRLNNGVGMAAVQMDYPFVTSFPNQVITIQLPNDPPRVLINPILIESEGEQKFEEGCLSIPTVFYTLKRAKTIRVAYRTFDGEHMDSTFSDFLAVVIQHEMDHLQGVLFIDGLSALKRMRSAGKVKKYLNKQEKLTK